MIFVVFFREMLPSQRRNLSTKSRWLAW